MDEPYPSQLDKVKIDNCMERIAALPRFHYSVSEISELLKPLFIGLKTRINHHQPYKLFYRARVWEDQHQVSQLSYPPNGAPLGRCNDSGDSIFYSASSVDATLYELRTLQGCEVVVSQWFNTKELYINHVGFTKKVSENLQSTRKLEEAFKFLPKIHEFGELNTKIMHYLAESFCENDNEKKEEVYKLSAAITQKLLWGGKLHGIEYPTIAMDGNDDNYAILPDAVDSRMKCLMAKHMRIKSVNGFHIEVATLKSGVVSGTDIRWVDEDMPWMVFKNGLSEKYASFG